MKMKPESSSWKDWELGLLRGTQGRRAHVRRWGGGAMVWRLRGIV